jgi:hypothetical protein
VLVDAAKHNELAQRTLAGETDAPFGVGVVLEEDPRMGTFDETMMYCFLESGGFGLRLAPGGVRRSGEKILRCHGTIVPLDELPK